MSESERLADEHWAWPSSLLEKVYKDAFRHGFKHGAEWAIKEEAVSSDSEH
jgi:hypothetical protein